MKQKLLLLLLLIFTINSFSQDSKYSIEANFPILVDNNFIGENYIGIIDLGFKARLIKFNNINYGISLNGGFYKYKYIIIKSHFKNMGTIQPKFYAELSNSTKFRPSLGIGYSFLIYRKSENVDNGLNFSLGLSYDINKILFIQTQFEIIFGTRDYSYKSLRPIILNSNNSIIKIGLGYRL